MLRYTQLSRLCLHSLGAPEFVRVVAPAAVVPLCVKYLCGVTIFGERGIFAVYPAAVL